MLASHLEYFIKPSRRASNRLHNNFSRLYFSVPGHISIYELNEERDGNKPNVVVEFLLQFLFWYYILT